ncbi:unnamed protein product [Linum trigynum]|uniref:Uncharacterized protein n=1 Tax=Linum trigynum TaxID=586398 RepID=A0AAV2DTQ4_9ROSI
MIMRDTGTVPPTFSFPPLANTILTGKGAMVMAMTQVATSATDEQAASSYASALQEGSKTDVTTLWHGHQSNSRPHTRNTRRGVISGGVRWAQIEVVPALAKVRGSFTGIESILYHIQTEDPCPMETNWRNGNLGARAGLLPANKEDDYLRALTDGPWTIFDHYLVVQQ